MTMVTPTVWEDEYRVVVDGVPERGTFHSKANAEWVADQLRTPYGTKPATVVIEKRQASMWTVPTAPDLGSCTTCGLYGACDSCPV